MLILVLVFETTWKLVLVLILVPKLEPILVQFLLIQIATSCSWQIKYPNQFVTFTRNHDFKL
jgi:hypothetical protein